MFSYNQYIQKIGGGIGAYSIYDNAAEGTLTSLLFNVVYAAHIELKNVVIQPAITVGYRTKHIEKDKLTFGDLIDPRYGFVYPTTTATDFSSERNFFDFGTGILCYTKTIYAGFSLDHLSEPEESFISPSPGSKLPRKYSFNAGFNIPSGDSGLWAFNPDIVFQRQRDFEEWIVSMAVKYSCMRAGIGVRKGDAIILLFGVQGERISASYSYDITTSSLSTASGGSHEISLLYRLRNKSSNGKRIALNSIAF